MDAAPPPEVEEDRAEAGAPEPGGDGGAPRAATPEAPGEADAPAAGGEGEDAPAGPVYKDDLEDSADDDDECAAPDVDAADGEFVPPSSIRKRGRRGERRRSPPRVPCDDPDADFKEITFAVRDVNAHLVCRLCDGYYRDAHTITECLHTFCKGCLLRHLETAPAPVCPHCNAGLGPHPMQGILHDRTMQPLAGRETNVCHTTSMVKYQHACDMERSPSQKHPPREHDPSKHRPIRLRFDRDREVFAGRGVPLVVSGTGRSSTRSSRS